MLSCTNLVKQVAVFIRLTLMVTVPLVSSVTKRQPVGGWTVFQKRLDGSVDFYRGWTDYKNGFGNLHGEFWLGLDKIHRLTTTIKNKLRVHLMDTKSKTAYAEYNMLAVASENKYKLSLGTYSGNLGGNKEIYFYENLQYSLTELETALLTCFDKPIELYGII